MINFWNERYKKENYAYGKLPNVFFKAELDKVENKGTLLLPAEGEGRNAIYAAKAHWHVTAFDPSIEGQKKALNLAKTAGVSINYLLHGYNEMEFEAESFDAIGLTFTHLPPHMRSIVHKTYSGLLKPGGKLILEGFSKEQLKYNSGGPADINMLFSKEELSEDFQNLNINYLEAMEKSLDEGDFHQGMASVIQLVATKR